MAGGTVHLRVLPNAEFFHTLLKKKIDSMKIDPVGVKIDPELAAWEKFERSVDAMDGRKVSLYVDVDDRSVNRLLDDLENSSGTIVRDLQVNTDDAQKQMNNFAGRNSGSIRSRLDIDFMAADEAMRDFSDHWADQEIRTKFTVDGLGSSKEDIDKWQDALAKMNSGAGRRVSGVRNLVDFDPTLVDAENFMRKLTTSMNAQFSIGLRQIYDQYFITLSKMWKLGSKPFLNLQQDWNSAKTFAEFFDNVRSRTEKANRAVARFTKDTKSSLKGLADAVKETSNLTKKIPGEISRAFADMRKELASRGGIIGNVKALAPDFGPLRRQMGVAVRGLGDKINEDFRAVGRKLTHSGVKSLQLISVVQQYDRLKETFDLWANSATGLSKAWELASVNIRNSSRRMQNNINAFAGNAFKSLQAGLSGIPQYLSNATSKIFSSVSNSGLGRGMGKMFGGVGNLVKKALPNFASMGKLIQNGAKRIMVPIYGLGRMAKGAMGTFAKNIFNGVKTVGSHLMSLGKVTRNLSRHFIGAFRKTVAALTPIGRVAKVTFEVVGRAIGPVMRILGNMQGLFKGVQKVMGRIGRVAAGASRMAIGAFSKVAGFMSSALVPAIMAVLSGIMAMGGQVVIGAVMALGGAIQSVAAGAIVMLPAVAGAAAASFAVLKIGAEGLGDSFKAAFSAESVEDFEKAIENLPPAMQAIARSMRQFKPMWDDMTANIQQNMFGGLDDDFAAAVGSMLPIFKSGAEEMSLSWNRAFENALGALSSPQATAGMQAIMDGTNEMAREMEPVLANLIKAAGSLAEQGAKFLGPLGSWVADLSEGAFNWAESLKEIDPKTGESFFDGIVASAQKNAALLGDILGGAFGTLGNVFKAGAEGGGGMLAGMAESMQNLKEYTSEGNEGFEKMVGFMKQATDFASQLGQVVEPIFSGALSVFTTLASVGSGAVDGLGTLLDSIASGLEGFEALGEDFGGNIGEIFAAAAPLVESLLVALQPVVAGLGEGLEKMFVPALEAAEPFFELLERLGGPIGDMLVTVGDAMGKILGPFISILGSVLTILEPIIPILDKVFFYIGEIVSALLIAIEPLFTMRDEAVAGLVQALGPLVEVLGEGLLGVIEALSPLFPILGGLFAQVVSAVTPLIEPLTKIAFVLFNALIDVIKMVMPIIPPIADLIGSLAEKLSSVLVVALNWLLNTWNKVWPTVASVLKFVIDNIIVPGIKILSAVIDGLASFIKWAIEWVIVPVLHVLSGVFSKVIGVIKWIIENVAQPAIDALKGAFEKAVDFIGNVWDGLKKLFAKPISFLIDVVMNKAIVPAWNWVMDLVGAEDRRLEPYKKPSDMNFHQGGVLPGYSVGKDNYNFVETRTGARLGLAGGEGIMRQEFVAAVGGKKGIDRLNEDARHGRLGVEHHDRSSAAHNQGGVFSFGNFASGGVIEAMTRIVQQKYPMLQMTSGFRPGDSGNHGRGLAADFSNGSGNTPAQLGLARDIAKTYPNSMELIYDSPGWSNNIKNGANVGPFGQFYTMAQAGPHHHHVHWAMNTPPTMPFGGGVFEGGSDGSGGGGGNWFSQAMSWVKEKVAAVTNFFTKPFNDLQSKVSGFGKFGATALDMGKKLGNEVKDNLIAKVKEHMPFGGGGNDSGPLGSPADVEVYRAGIIDAFKRQGEDPLAWRVDALLRQIWTESKGDPNIAQQIVDVNGTGESAGVGLYQVIPGTWAAYRDPELPDDRRNVEAAHNFAVRYFRDRHHWNTGPGGVGLPNTGWKDGGVLPSFFDLGGEARGTGMLAKNVINPERVLSPAQTKAFNDFVYSFMPEMIEQFRRNPANFARIGNQISGEIKKLLFELKEGRIKAIQANVADTYRRRLKGESLADSPVDLNFDMDWLARNQDNLERSYNRASKQVGMVYSDPEAYVEAEKRAREQIDKEREEEREAKKAAAEEAKKEAKEEAKEKKSKLEEDRKKAVERGEDAKVAEIDKKIDELNRSAGTDYEATDERIETERKRAKEEAAKDLEAEKEKLREERDEAVKGVKDEAEKEKIRNSYEDKIDNVDDRIKSLEKTVDKKFDEQKSANDEARQAEEDRQRKIEERENERIEKAKADGSYYYGYKVFDDEGQDPRDIERSEEEGAFRSFMESASGRVGLGDTFSGLATTFDDVRRIGEAGQIAMPAWIAALNGDPSGLAHNIAVGQAAVIRQGREGATDLGPDALAGIIEMAISGSSTGTSGNAPFIGEVHSGMTQAELMQTLEHYEMKRARRGTGTTRVR